MEYLWLDRFNLIQTVCAIVVLLLGVELYCREHEILYHANLVCEAAELKLFYCWYTFSQILSQLHAVVIIWLLG